MNIKSLMACGMLILSSLAFAKETVWSGAEDALWTNANNWSDGVPGALDTAVFDATGASGATTIDLSGHALVSNIVVRGAACPKYVFGTSATQKLLLPFFSSQTTGSGFHVESSVPAANVPEIVAVLGGTLYASPAYLTIDNQSSGTLHMNDYGYATRASGVASGAYARFSFTGSGETQVDGTKNTLSQSGYTVEMNFRGTGKVKVAKSVSMGRLLSAGDKSIWRELEIPAGVTVNMAAGFQLIPVAPMHIFGDGSLGFWPGTSSCFEGEMAVDGLFANTFDVRFVNQGSPNATMGIRCYGRGVWTFNNTANDLGGPLYLYCDSGSSTITFAAPVFGNISDSSSCLGPNVTKILFGRSGRVRHTGSTADTTDRTFVFGGVHGWNTINSTMRIEQQGSGAFTITGGFESESGANSAALTLAGTGTGDGVIASVITNQPGRELTLTKEESGRWVLTGVNTYTGTTTVNAGTLAFRNGGSIASSPLTLKSGARLEVEGTTSIKSVAAPSGTSTIALAAGARLELTGMTSGGGTVAVTAGDGAVLVCPALQGAAPAWLTLNGQAAEFDASGNLVKLDVVVTDQIAARGGVIPDGSDKVVGITTDGAPGDGPVTLSASSVAIDTLAQKTRTDAVVSLSGGGRLSLGTVFVSENCASLTLGATPGEGTLAAASGGEIIFDSRAEDPAGITVNAAVDADTLSVRSGTLRLAEPSYTVAIELMKDARLVVTNESLLTFRAQVTGSQSASNKIVKTGAGHVKYTSMSGYSGDFVLVGGTNEISKALCGSGNVTAFGSVPSSQAAAATAGSVFVTNGATLFVNDDPVATGANKPSGLTFGYKNFHFSGTGVGGLGALILRDYHTGLFRNITLDGDALFRGETGGYTSGYIQINENGTLDMQRHSLDLAGACHLVFADNSRIVNSGRLTLEDDVGKTKTLDVYANADLGGAEDEPIVMKGKFQLYSYRAKAQKRPFVFDADLSDATESTVYPRLCCAYNDAGTNINHLAGDIVFAESNATPLRIGNAGDTSAMPTFTLSGKVSGHGGFLFPKWHNMSYVCLYLAGAGNTFTEGVNIPGGMGALTALRLGYPTSVPDYAKIHARSARVIVDAWNWTGTNVFKLAREADLYAGSLARIYGYTADAPNSTATIEIDGGSYSGTEAPIDHYGPGKLLLKPIGAWGKSLRVASSGGTLGFTGPGSVMLGGELSIVTASDAVEPAAVSFEGGVNATLGYGPIVVGSSVGTSAGTDRIARLRFGQATARASTAVEGMSTAIPLRVGQYGDGIMEILPGADVRTSFLLGYGTNGTESAHGAVYQSGGTLDANGNPSYYGVPWLSGVYGFYSISGGLLKSDDLRSGMFGRSYCSLRQSGGETQFASFRLGSHHSVADWVVSGGSANLNSLFPPNPSANVKDQVSVVTVEGTASVAVSNTIYAAGGVQTTDAIFNLNGGTFAAAAIVRHGSQDWMTDHNSDRVFVNFNGGTLKALQKNQNLLGHESAAVTRTTVYGGGATIDTTGFGEEESVTISVPLTAPTGNGVASIPSPGVVMTGRDLVGPPGVKIIGDGTGASAICDFNVATREVTGVRVTCPGCDYTWAKAEFSYGFDNGAPFVVTNDCVLTAETPASGGLVKTGTGMLRLGGGNSYTGDTVVEGGTLFLSAANSLPEHSRVTCRGGTVAVASGVTMPAVDCFYAIGTTVASSGSIEFAEGSTITIAGLTTVSDEVGLYVVAEYAGGISGARPTILNADELPEGWEVRVGTTSIRVRKVKGSVMIFR